MSSSQEIFLSVRLDQSTQPVKDLLRRKQHYVNRVKFELENKAKEEEERLKRVREEPSDEDEEKGLPTNQSSQNSSSRRSKKRNRGKQKSVEEEVIRPKLTPHGTHFVIGMLIV